MRLNLTYCYLAKRNKILNKPVLYVFVRSDLPSLGSSCGKMAAHSSHAANAFINEHYVRKVMADKDVAPSVKEWMGTTIHGFGTQINLKGDWGDVVDTVAGWVESGGKGELIADPTYPYIVDSEIVTFIDSKVHTADPVDLGNGMFVCHRDELTAAYLFGYKDELKPHVGKYPLHP